ncbi:MAG: ABC transporter substrate-binding protein [Thermoproteota archaeon]|nr:ABC transporter substrate-binding protein [Thermoproteota archaeon]
MRKTVCAASILLLTSMLTLAFNIQPAYVKPALATIYETSQQYPPFNQSHIIVAAMWLDPRTVDPAWAYDSISWELIFNVYEPLIFYAVNRSAPPAQAGKVDQFVPRLAINWTISSDGKTYTFKIRENVKFHNNETLTTEDVEYSFERAMVQDKNGGPTWMIYEALLGCWDANLSDPNWHLKIENAVQHNDTHVWFNLVKPYAPFLQILCQPWSSIVNKKFCVEHEDWPANETVGKWFWPGGNWTQYHNPDTSPLDTGGDWMCGTGPYKLDYWTHDVEYSLVKFDDYWGGWPAPNCSNFVSRATFKKIEYWKYLYDGFVDGSFDIIYVPREYYEQLEEVPGVRYIKDLPSLVCGAFFFTFNINTTSPYMGVPRGLPPSTFNETGIPPDFFSDVDVRRGFAHSFNWTKYIEHEWSYKGEAIQSASPVIEGLPYRNPDQEKYQFNLTEAETYLKRAWGGKVWQEGFTMTLAYNTGSAPRLIWAEVFEEGVESLNPKFHINLAGVSWPTYLEHLVHSELPMFDLGWLGDYPDPHNFVEPFMHSEGDFIIFQGYWNETVDDLIEAGLRATNTTRRREIYYKLQSIYHDDCPSLPFQPLGRHWERDWVRGWYYNPAYPGQYFYHLWKQKMGDVDGDGDVNLFDLTIIGTAWDSKPGDANWDQRADIDNNGWVYLPDLTIVGTYWEG